MLAAFYQLTQEGVGHLRDLLEPSEPLHLVVPSPTAGSASVEPDPVWQELGDIRRMLAELTDKMDRIAAKVDQL